MYDHALFHTEVTDLTWDDARSRWVIRTNRGDAFTAQFLGMGTGPQHVAKLPGIPGIDEFGGHSFHTSRWDYDYTGGDANGAPMSNLADKRVGIIGTRATAVKCIPPRTPSPHQGLPGAVRLPSPLTHAKNLISNVPHNFTEAARAIAAVVTHAVQGGYDEVEVSKAGEDEWMDLLHGAGGLGIAGIIGSSECTPGYYNNEGQPGGLGRELLLAYPAGPVAYFQYLKEWCVKGDFEGLDFR